MDGVEDDDKDIPAYYETKILVRRLEDLVVLLRDFCVWDEKKKKF